MLCNLCHGDDNNNVIVMHLLYQKFCYFANYKRLLQGIFMLLGKVGGDALFLLYFQTVTLNTYQFKKSNQKTQQYTKMNQNSDPIQKKAKQKAQPKIHRRKNDQISKQFFCPVQSCSKGYGSYAALYTHMKNKHNEIKPPNMPTTVQKNKNSHPGRPKTKKNENQKNQDLSPMEINAQEIVCKICQQQECQCVQNFDSQEKRKVIEIMSCEKFNSFTNQVGVLSSDDINWVRRTEQQYSYKSPDQIREQIESFNQAHNLDSNPSQKLIQYLSFSSKYWNPANIDELYQVIYAMIGLQNHQQCVKFVLEGEFPKMQSCIQKNPNQFKKLESIVRLI